MLPFSKQRFKRQRTFPRPTYASNDSELAMRYRNVNASQIMCAGVFDFDLLRNFENGEFPGKTRFVSGGSDMT
ncbi:MAG TPA: hypothetical protein DIW81_06900 [Planctomycetaceae bacterium]|nr:hypothetical protein [Rubinisphaera sp.]HCS51309.1 hypothetical protein [Planctomycetaceae bacterium]|tara:strand:+ start:6615 stop:6833 length:219 start_codon:yes stop_codon:yes gene_type:complete